jgi:maltose alpha-D-glucosyltransferase/alpha-amylase
LLAALATLAQGGAGALICRIHGDFHLGQVLVAAGDVYIIDFEGQPSTPLEERRHKESPLRDAAGLLRSLDYAAATAAQGRGVSASTGNQEARRAFITRFRDATTSAFLSAYRESAARSGEALNESLLDLFMIEKSAYEIRYEAANRPAWLPIPLAGLAGLVRRLISRGVLHGER